MSQNFLIDNLVNQSLSPSLNLSNNVNNNTNISKPLNSSDNLTKPFEFSNLTQSILFNQESAKLLTSLNNPSLLNNNLSLNKINSLFSNSSTSNNLLLKKCIDSTENNIQTITKNNKSFLPDLYKLKKTDIKKTNSDGSTPIRQTLSYLDVIFPHIRIICENSNTNNNRNKNLQLNDEEKNKELITSQTTKTILNNDQLQWLELLQNSFFNFPSLTSNENNFPTSSLLGPNINNGNDGQFFFQQMQKIKRNRTTFSSTQLDHLEQVFKSNHYVIGNERKSLAECLQLSETQVKVWFQNRRTKQKRFKTTR